MKYKKCKAIRKNGKKCRCKTIFGLDYCFRHLEESMKINTNCVNSVEVLKQ